MTQFKALKDLCNKLEEDLKVISTEVFGIEVAGRFEDLVAKKLKTLAFFSAKAKLLQAKPLLLTQPPPEQDKDVSVILAEYEDTVQSKLIERLKIKSVMQTHAVKTLLMTPNARLTPELIERKKKIMKSLENYCEKEIELQKLDFEMKEKEEELTRMRQRWHELVGVMRDMKVGDIDVSVEESGPYYDKMVAVCAKISIMRWLTGSLAEARTRGYDWLRDPRGRLAAIKAARTSCDVNQFLL